jgi:hypothetical protein
MHAQAWSAFSKALVATQALLGRDQPSSGRDQASSGRAQAKAPACSRRLRLKRPLLTSVD